MSLFVENLTIKRGAEGPQLVLNWTLPTLAFTSLRIRRRKAAHPETTTEGVEVLSTTTLTSFSDTGVTGGEMFYYTIFTEEPAGVFTFNATTQVSEIALSSGFFEDRMYLDYLPALYRVSDRGATIERVLTATTASDGEKFNLTEDGVTGKGPLQRFLKIFGVLFDEIRGLTQFTAALLDVDRVPSEFLGDLGAIIGIEFNPDIPILRQRQEIKRAVEIYKVKGTLGSIETLVEGITNLNITVDEKCDNILIFNRTDRTFFLIRV